MTERVEVTAESVRLVDANSATVGHTVTAEEINRLPKTRTFQSIALTAPSLTHGDIEGGIQVNGASGAENAFTVDGVDTTSIINGSSRQNTIFEYIQEVQVKTTGIPAEYGGALGGVISAVTRSGGQIFNGEIHYYARWQFVADETTDAARSRPFQRDDCDVRSGYEAAGVSS